MNVSKETEKKKVFEADEKKLKQVRRRKLSFFLE